MRTSLNQLPTLELAVPLGPGNPGHSVGAEQAAATAGAAEAHEAAAREAAARHRAEGLPLKPLPKSRTALELLALVLLEDAVVYAVSASFCMRASSPRLAFCSA